MEREVLSFASRVIDEMSLRLEAVLKGTIVLMRSASAGEDLMKTLGGVCAERLCLARIDIGGTEGSVVVLRGAALAAYLRSAGEELAGAEAFERVVEIVRRSGGNITVYELPEREFEERYAEVVKRVKERGPTLREGAPPHIPRVELLDIHMRLLSELRAQGFPLASLSIEPRNGDIKVTADWVGRAYYPSHAVLTVVRELVNRGVHFKKVELESRVRDKEGGSILETSRIRLETEDPAVWKSLTTVLRASAKHGFLVRDLDFKLRRDLLRMSLDVVIPYGRASQLSPAAYRGAAKTIAEDVLRAASETWRGKVEVRVSVNISTLQGYIELEGRAP